MAFNNNQIDPSSVSNTSIEQDLRTFLQNQPDSQRWKDFFASSTGTQVIKLISGLGAMLNYNIVAGRREGYIQYAVNKSSVIAAGQTLGYSANRGRNAVVKLTISPNVSSLIPKYSIIGTVKDKDLVLLEPVVLNAGIQTTLYAVVGDKKSESITVPTADPATFRFTYPNVSQDLRVLLNGNEVSTSERILDLINGKFVVQTNVNSSVDVKYLNLDNFPIILQSSDVLELEYIELNNLEFLISDVICDIGTIVTSSIESVFDSAESTDSVKINAPLFHETQFVIRGRDDYMKVFRLVDSNIVDTGYRDVSPAVVQLTYVKEDLDLYSNSELNDIVLQLSGYRTMGVEPPTIAHPQPVFLNMKITIKLLDNSGNPQADVETIISTHEKVLEHEIVFADLEKELETLSFTKIARAEIESDTWEGGKLYVRGCHVTPTTPNDIVYEMLNVIHKSSSVMPDFVNMVNETIDGTVVWCPEPRLVCQDDGLPLWQPDTIYREGDYVVAPVVMENGNTGIGNNVMSAIVTTNIYIGMLVTGPNLPPNTIVLNKTVNTVTLSNAATGAGTNQYTFTLMKKFRACDFIHKSASSSEIQELTFSPTPTGGTFRLSCGVDQTPDLPYNITAANLQTALNNLSCYSGVIVTGDYINGFTIVFAGADANINQDPIDIADLGTDEVQCITFDYVPTSGTFVINFDGQNTAPIAYNANLAAIQAALEALSNVDPGDVIVSGNINPSKLIQIQFDNNLGRQNLPEITINSNSLTAAVAVTVTPSTTVQGAGSAGNNEQQLITFDQVPTGGSFALTYEFTTTALIPYNATAGQVQTALENLISVGVGQVSVSGDFINGFLVEFVGAYANSNRNAITVATNTLVKSDSVVITPSTTQEGGGGNNEVQKIDFNFVPTAGQWKLKSGTSNYSTPMLNYFDSAAVVQTALENLFITSSGDLTFIQENQPGDTSIGFPLVQNIITTNIYPGMKVTGAGIPANTIVISTTVNTVTLNNNATSSVLANPLVFTDASDIVTNIVTTDVEIGTVVSGTGIPGGTTVLSKTANSVTLSNPVTQAGIVVPLTFTRNNVGNIVVTGDYLNGFLITHQGSLTNTNVPPYNVIFNTLVTDLPFAINTSTVINGAAPVAPVNEVQNIAFNKIPDSGTYVLDFNGQQTAPINYNDTAVNVKSKLEALSNIGAGNVQVSATLTGFNITFINALGGSNQNQITVASSSLNASSAPIDAIPCTLVEGQTPSNNLVPIVTPTVTTLEEGTNPEPNWFGGLSIC